MKRKDFRTLSLKELEDVLQRKLDHWYEMGEGEGEELWIKKNDLYTLGDIIMIQNEIITRLILSE
jgi:hypothetical protein